MRKLFIAVTVFLFLSIDAYFYRASVWEYYDQRINQNKRVIICHDIHNYSEHLNRTQIECFNKILSNTFELHLILENHSVPINLYRDNNLYNVCIELAQFCKDNGNLVEHADFRIKKSQACFKCMKAVGYTEQYQYNELNTVLLSLNCTTRAIAQEFNDEYQSIIEKIKVFLEASVLSYWNAALFTRKCSLAYAQSETELQKWENFDGTFLEYCQHNKCLTIEYLMYVLSFDASLLDVGLFCRILSSDNSLVVVAAGAAHCRQLEIFLRDFLNGRLVATQGEDVDFSEKGGNIKVPENIPAHEVTRYLTKAERLYTVSGVELTPVASEFFEKYLQK